VRRVSLSVVVAIFAALLIGASSATARPAGIQSDATYFNNAAFAAADPYVMHDPRTGFYYAYSTEGADNGYYFAVYRSADMVTWEKAAPGALPVNDPNQWGNTWFWAPETYYDARTHLYFLFYAARSDANAQAWFGYGNFEEPCKIGVAVSRSPAGPFHNIANHPIDYNPYDPNYHDVNLIMGPDQKKPATLQQGDTAPLGTYIPTIDPDVFFDSSGRVYLYFSRNAYRNWVWDYDLGKYIEESNIYAVELTKDWWNDPTGRTMPTIAPQYRGANASSGGPTGPRRDGWVRILDYDHDKQAWENADVNDYALSGGQNKDRRWEEGSSILETHFNGRTRYYLTYSANNWQTPQYGVGYAVSSNPLGPFHKSSTNPILQANPAIGEWSPGHGSFAFSPDGTQLYYVHHGRPSPDDSQRRLYTDQLHFSFSQLDPWGNPTLYADEATSDRPVPSGVAPYRITASRHEIVLRPGSSRTVRFQVLSADGTPLALENPLNRLDVRAGNPSVASASNTTDGATVTVTALSPGRASLVVSYDRLLANGTYRDVHQGQSSPQTVSIRLRILVRR
jgi:GH43 family beta-xylosidase